MGLIIGALILTTLRMCWGRITGRPVQPVAMRGAMGRLLGSYKVGPPPRGMRLAPAAAFAPLTQLTASGATTTSTPPTTSTDDCEVLVVGAGPTGLIAAALLKRSGVKVRIVERRNAPSTESRAFAMQARSVELFQALGLDQAILSRGIVNTSIDFHVKGKRVGGLNFDRAAAPDTPFQFIFMIPQCETEDVLIDDLRSLGVEVERGVEVTALSQTADSVTTQCSKVGGAGFDIRSAYVIGADGAHSMVRKQLGMRFEGSNYEQSFLLADCKVTWDMDHARFRIFMNRDRVGLFLPLHGERTSRVMATDFSGKSGNDMTLEELQAAFSEAVGVPVKLSDPVWTTRYRVHHRGVDNYRQGRAFVAGDAAHIHSPAGGQGMNTGLQDASNLCWKLAAVLRGGAADSLLDSYHAERYPVGQDVLRFTDRLFSAAAAQTGWRAGLRDNLVAFVAKRATMLPIPHRKAFRKLSEINIAYPKGHYVEDWPLPSCLGPYAGERAPDAAVSHTTNVFSLISGYKLQILVFSRKQLVDAEIAQISTQLAHLKAHLPDVATHLVARVGGRRDPRVEFVNKSEVFNRYGLRDAQAQAIYVLRPDGYVAWRAPGLDFEGCEHFLSRLHGASAAVEPVSAAASLAYAASISTSASTSTSTSTSNSF